MNETKTVILVSKKSMGVAFILTFLFGPLGLLYSSVIGGIIMIVLTLILGITTIIGVIPCWIICIIWGLVAASNHNKKIYAASK
jgi:hypothetical protein